MNPIKSRLILIFILWIYFIPVSIQAEETLHSIRSTGVLNWGSDAEGGAPYVFPDPNTPGKLIGFEVDLADAIAHQLGVVAHQYQTHWASLIPSLERGDFHMAMNGIEWTAERAGKIDFTDPYFIYTQRLVVQSDNNDIHSLNDVIGKRVGTLGGTVSHDMLKAIPGIQVMAYDGQVEPYRDLGLRRLDAVFMDSPITAYFSRLNPNLKHTGQPVGENVYVVAVRKGDTAFKNEINRVINTLFRAGKIKTIYERWGLWDDNQARLWETDSRQTVATLQSKDQIAPKTGKTSLLQYIPLLLKGAVMTVLISVTAMALAVTLGLIVALTRLLGGRFLRPLAVAYIEIIRGTPLLLQLYIVYYGLPNIGLTLNSFTAAVLALGMNYAAYEAENYRAGLESIPKGQSEAALSLGMTQFLVYRRILIPQAAKVSLPPITNDFIALFKDSSLVSIIAIVELTKSYNMLAVSSMRFLELGLLTAALYLMMSLPLSFLTRKLERQLS